jgi:hypothetical protein
MEVAPEVQELEVLAQTVNVPMSRALARAGVSLSTYWRWRHAGKEPLTTTVRKVRAAIEELAAA